MMVQDDSNNTHRARLAQDGEELIRVRIGNEFRLVTRSELEDLEDIAAAERAKKSGELTSYADFRKELGL